MQHLSLSRRGLTNFGAGVRAGLGLASCLWAIGLASCAGTATQHAAKAESAVPAARASAVKVPASRTVDVTDRFYGVSVADPYRWLENWDDAEVKAWSDAQNAYARSVLDAMPNVEAIRARASEVMSAQSPSQASFELRGNTLFSLKRQPPLQQPLLIAQAWDGAKPGAEKVLLDLNTFDESHSTTIDWYIPSEDGKYLAVSMSSGGSEMGDVHVLDAASGKQVFEIVHRVNGGTAGGSLAWAQDGKGFFYTRYPREGERAEADMNFYVQAYYHALGTPESQDRYEIGKDFPRIAEVMLETTRDARGGEWVLASVQKGDGGEFMHWVKPAGQAWTQVTRYEDRAVQACMSEGEGIYWVSRKDALRGKLLRTPLDAGRLTQFEEVIPQGQDSIENDFFEPSVMRVTKNFIYLTYQTGGPSEARVFDKQGRQVKGPELFPVSTVTGMAPLAGDSMLLSNTSYINPPTWKVYTPGVGGAAPRTTLTKFGPEYPGLDLSKYDVRREFATSKDGTKVPVNIVCKKGLALDKQQPTLLTGYGGYGVCITPGFSLRDVLMLEQGFVLAEANLRGGGEYGEAWHLAGNLTKKQNVFDDFIAASEHLIQRGYTCKEKLAIEGGSNGGLLMGAAMTQRPDLFRCVVSHVGIYDMLRVELSPNGAFNITEFGTVQDEAQFRALHAYSPYHHVRQATPYPPVLFMTGANDPRVDPMQSRKMTAQLQAIGATALLRTSSNTGHGAGTPLNARIEQTVDGLSFLCERLGVAYKSP